MTNDGLHEFRRQIDACIVLAGCAITCSEGESCPYDREMELATTKLQEAKMWVGKCLEARGSKLPKEFQDKSEETGK